MRWTRSLRTTNAGSRGRRRRVVLAPRCWCQVPGKFPGGDGGKKAVRREEHVISRKPSRREGRVFSAGPVCSCALFFAQWHTRPRVQRAPGLPCALSLHEGENSSRPRALRVARMRRLVIWLVGKLVVGRGRKQRPCSPPLPPRALARGGVETSEARSEGSAVGVARQIHWPRSKPIDPPPPTPPRRYAEGGEKSNFQSPRLARYFTAPISRKYFSTPG
jgi:hypothetical protein